MKKELNNKGFSLVELIIVIAIMAVLMGVLAPQYLKYVKSSKVSTDITNAEEIATAINVAVADSTSVPIATSIPFAAGTVSVAKDDVIVNDKNGNAKVKAPAVKVNSAWTWDITWDDVNGVTKIEVNGDEIWPSATAYETTNG